MRNRSIIDDLSSLISRDKVTQYIEARCQLRMINQISFSSGEVETIRNVVNSGCGVRVLVNGCWGFSGTNDMSKAGLRRSISEAISAGKVLSEIKKIKVKGLASSRLARGLYKTDGKHDLCNIDLEQKVKVTRETEAQARHYSADIKSASCIYNEILDNKIIVNSDGAEVQISDSKAEFNVISVARRGSKNVTASEGRGITGGWKDLFSRHHYLDYAALASEKAVRLLDARYAIGEKTTIILDPGMVGLISHEAIGHMVEADFVLAGSMVKDKMGQKIASELVTLVDSGQSNIIGNAAGTIAVDDEGVIAGKTVIIEKGILKSFLHNRESALIFGTRPTGNARAFEYNDEPLIRMTNTFIEPRSDKVDDMIKETRHGFLIKGPRNGQADANGEFMFGCQEIYLIEKGEIRSLMMGTSISGNTLDVLGSVDMVGNDFNYDIGTGYCGKSQPAKVDGGGPHIRCTAIVGGLQ